MKSYKTVKQDGISEFIEKKSRFISYVYNITAESQALELIDKARKKYYDSTHVVFAYKVQENNIQRFSDDGEPQGTAGVPVLEVINKAGITDVLVIVVRYFGGTLLGAGGLVRAYSKSASMGVEAARIITMCECVDFEINCSYDMLGKIQYVLNENGAVKEDILYADNVVLKYYIAEEELEKLKSELTEAFSGTVTLTETNRDFKSL